MSATESHRGLWVGVALGVPVMAFALWGIVEESAATDPPEMARWLLGGLVVHDLLLAPLVAGVGVLLGRVLGPPWRLPVRTGLFASAVVVAVAWAPLGGYGRDQVPDNPSVQPLDYASGTATVLAVVWAAVAVWVAWSALSGRRARTPARRDD